MKPSIGVIKDKWLTYQSFITFCCLYLVIEFVYGTYFPIDGIRMGHDYSIALPWLLDGKFWFAKNGLAVPWFTPSFCAGQPFFPDPQSFFYSVPQLLALLLSPVETFHVTLLLFISIFYWGTYLLVRQVFGLTASVATLAASLLMLNGFLPHRLIIGHVGFHGIALVPLVCLALLKPTTSRWQDLALSLLAGGIFAYWVHASFSTLIIPAAISICLVASIHTMIGGDPGVFVRRCVNSVVIASCLAAAKLVAVISFMTQFPRSNYLMAGGSSILDTLAAIGGALTMPAQWAYEFGMPHLTNLQWALAPHEWAFNFPAAFFLLGGYVVVVCFNSPQRRQPADKHPFATMFLVAGLLIPLAINYFSPTWNQLLKSIPIVNSTSTPLRWIIVYFPVVAILLALGVERCIANLPTRNTLIYLSIALSAFQVVIEPRGYFENQHYNIGPIELANRALENNTLVPQITQLDTTTEIVVGDQTITLGGNDIFISGASQVFCYNPVFGYKLEKYSADGLHSGDVLSPDDLQPNMKNPSCYVFPKANDCKPGDQFTKNQWHEARQFANYAPFNFTKPQVQLFADHLSKVSILSFPFLLLLAAIGELVSRRRRNQ